ncbi:MAG: uracil-DNA glycosylase [Candidatus Omnitrophica bacterium]|nr:uracil-DNA glycosylase [Candidatus Omnitrophota bacterium]
MSDMRNSFTTYRQFAANLASSDCRGCALSESRSRIVVDRGTPGSDVLLVGEAPGRTEDEEGRAFVGRSGKLLDRLFLEEGFDTNRQSLVINVVKCRPPQNRPPRPEEARACMDIFREQFSLAGPRWVVLLGRTALKHLFPERAKLPMNEIAGSFFDHTGYPGIRFIVFFHPAYLLRDPRKIPAAREHIRSLLEERRNASQTNSGQ